MRAKICIRAALAAAILGGGFSLPLPEPFGIAAADAKEFYTRKRVNGRWITGRFAKRSQETPRSTPAKEAAKAAPAQAQTRMAETGPAAPPQAPAQTPVPPPAAEPARPDQNRLAPLQKALEQRARSMAARDTGAAPNVRSVTYDFDKGRKTVIYLDGTVKEEPLDPVATGQVVPKP